MQCLSTEIWLKKSVCVWGVVLLSLPTYCVWSCFTELTGHNSVQQIVARNNLLSKVHWVITSPSVRFYHTFRLC